MFFREMKEEDLDRVSELEKCIFSTPWSRESFSDSLKQSYSYFFVAEENEDIVGYLGIHNLGGDGEVTNVAVDEKFRGRGIAYAMLQYAMDETKRHGVTAFTLEVRKSNVAAISLYEKHGFENCGIRKNFYENPTEDAVIMWKN